MAITLNWPHSYNTIFTNPKTTALNVPWLGRHGVVFNPGEKIAIAGNPLLVTERPNRYNGKNTLTDLAVLIADGDLEVLSIAGGGDNEMDNTTVPFVDTDGVTPLPGCRFVS